MKYEINLGAWNQIFAVPAAVVDRHLKLAGSAQLKVLLWLLRYAGTQNDPEIIGQALGLSRADVCDAMQYWISAGLIREDREQLVPPESVVNEVVVVEAAAPAAPVVVGTVGTASSPLTETAKQPRRSARPKQLNTGEITERINTADEIRYIIDAAESIFGRPLSTPEMGTLINLYDWDGLPGDVIIMIIQYALNNGKCNMRYIEKMATSWAAEGIDSHEKAEEKVRQLDERAETWTRVSRLFGIEKRPPSAFESEAVTRWINDWKFDEKMLREAYDQCVNNTGKVQLKYINKVLERWHSEGIYTVADTKTDSRKKTPAAPSAKHVDRRSYDLDEFEKALFDEELPQ